MPSNTSEVRVAYIGNFEPEFSTENEVKHALGVLGCEVDEIQEHNQAAWELLVGRLFDRYYDMVLWTSTAGLVQQLPADLPWRMLDAAERNSIPTVGYHLDRWWGLDREHQLRWPFFSCESVFTADGGHQAEFEEVGINHTWAPPGISERWCRPGNFRDEYACDVVFVGGWDNYGHREWKHRTELISFLGQVYGDGFLALPKRGHHAIRGLELNDVYWSAKVVVGDSCLVPNTDGSPATHYCSDRVPETMGRGGVLVHPHVDGVSQAAFSHWSWPLGDWAELRRVVDELIHNDEVSETTRQTSMAETRLANTYTERMKFVLTEILGVDP